MEDDDAILMLMAFLILGFCMVGLDLIVNLGIVEFITSFLGDGQS